MDNEKIKNFITTQREAGIPDAEIYSFLQSKGVVSDTIEQPQETQGETGIRGFATGVGKGVLSTFKGAGQLGEKIVNLVVPKKYEMPSVYSDEATEGTILSEETLKPQTTAESIGKGVEQIAEFAVPGSKVAKATKGANLLTRIIPRALTSGTVATVQAGDIGKETAIAAGIETALPVAGKVLKPATKIISRLFRNVGSALSGVPSETLQRISSNPQIANDAVKVLKETGKDNLLRQNAKTILNGIQSIKKEAGGAYRQGLEKLSKADIKPQIIKDEVKNAITSNKGILTKTGFSLKNAEFASDTKLVKKASSLINEINNSKDLSGRGLRKLMEAIDTSKLKKATSDVNMSYNSFLDDISKSLQNAIRKSTTKLDEINKAYSSEKQLIDTIESIIGKVKFNNEKELVSASKRLNTAFKETDLTGEALDKLLTRIGITPDDFKTSEAVRQISNIQAGANQMGTNKMELVRSLTGSIVTPKTVRDIAILTGKTEQAIKPILEKLDPVAKSAIIELFTE